MSKENLESIAQWLSETFTLPIVKIPELAPRLFCPCGKLADIALYGSETMLDTGVCKDCYQLLEQNGHLRVPITFGEFKQVGNGAYSEL